MKVVTVFSAKRLDPRSRKDLSESTTPCSDAQSAGLCLRSNPICLTVLVTKSERYITTPRHLWNLSLDSVESLEETRKGYRCIFTNTSQLQATVFLSYFSLKLRFSLKCQLKGFPLPSRLLLSYHF